MDDFASLYYTLMNVLHTIATHYDYEIFGVGYQFEQCHVCLFKHIIRLIQQTYFQFIWREIYLFMSESINLFINKSGSPLLRSIELNKCLFKVLFQVFSSNTKRRCGFSNSGRPLENHMSNAFAFDYFFEILHTVLVSVDLIQVLGSILVQPILLQTNFLTHYLKISICCICEVIIYIQIKNYNVQLIIVKNLLSQDIQPNNHVTRLMKSQKIGSQIRKQTLKTKVANLNAVIMRIRNMEKNIQIQDLGKINRVMFVHINIKHTSQFILHLGSDYYAEIKTETALQILQRRKQKFSKQLLNLQCQQKLLAKSLLNPMQSKQRKPKQVRIGNGTLQVIGQQNGEQIINIVEKEDVDFDFKEKDESQYKNQQKKDIKNQINLTKQIVQQPKNIKIRQTQNELLNQNKQMDILLMYEKQRQEKMEQQIKRKNIQNIQQDKKEERTNSKKISKFKAQKIKQRQK